MGHACKSRLLVSKDHRRDVSVGMCMSQGARIIFEIFPTCVHILHCCHVRLCVSYTALNIWTCTVSCWATRWWHVCFQDGSGVFVHSYNCCAMGKRALGHRTRMSNFRVQLRGPLVPSVVAGQLHATNEVVSTMRRGRTVASCGHSRERAQGRAGSPTSLTREHFDKRFPCNSREFQGSGCFDETGRLQVAWELHTLCKGYTHRQRP